MAEAGVKTSKRKRQGAWAKVHRCSKCGREGHKAPTCSFKRRVGSPRPISPQEARAIGLEVENTSEVNAELNTKTCACPTCGTTFTGQQVFDALRESNKE